MTTDRLVGQDLAHYRVEAVLGRGGMGVVYRAVDTHLGRTVALKVLSGDRALDPEFRERFGRESRLLASIDHPHIVPIFEAGATGDVLYIAMRFIPGPELRQIIVDEAPMNAERAIGIIGQVADALDAAHLAGLVHRDVKPGNVLVLPGATPVDPGYAYLTDFGLTKATASDTGLTKMGQFVGTPGYIAPEQIEGLKVDHRADNYALGCILYNCLSGNVPYPRESTVASLFAHLQAPPPKLSERRPDLPRALDAVIAKALAKAPDQRYQTCGALALAAREALARPKRARRPAAGAAALPIVDTTATAAGATLITPAPALPPTLASPSPVETVTSETPLPADGVTSAVAASLAPDTPAPVVEPEAVVEPEPAAATVVEPEPAIAVEPEPEAVVEPEPAAPEVIGIAEPIPTLIEAAAPPTVLEAPATPTLVETPPVAASAASPTVLDDARAIPAQALTVAAPPATTPERAAPPPRTDETILPPRPSRDAGHAIDPARQAKRPAIAATAPPSERAAVDRKSVVTARAVAVLVLVVVLVGIVVGVAWDFVVVGPIR